MKSLLTLSLACILASGTPLPGQTAGDDAYDELTGEFEQVLDEWSAELRAAASRDEQRELRAHHPAKAFYPRFEAFGEQGQGRALLWMTDNARHAFDKARAAREAKVRLFALLVERHHSEPWAGEIVVSLGRQKSSLGEEVVRAHLLAIGNASEEREVGAAALLSLARRLRRGDAEDERQAEALWDRIDGDFAGTVAAGKVKLARTAKLYEVGATPPDFTTKDVDDVEFKLSDYRGKVVMLDFWGFW